MTRMTNETIVGTYGLWEDPEILLEDGKTTIAELYFVLPDGTPGDKVCQSRGCDFCNIDTPCCRNNDENKDLEVCYFY